LHLAECQLQIKAGGLTLWIEPQGFGIHLQCDAPFLSLVVGVAEIGQRFWAKRRGQPLEALFVSRCGFFVRALGKVSVSKVPCDLRGVSPRFLCREVVLKSLRELTTA